MNEEQRTSIITHKNSREVGNTSDGTVINPVSNKNLGHARQAKEAAEKRCVDHVGYMHRVDMPCFTTLKCTPVARTLHEGSAECVPHMGGTCVSCTECITLLFSHLERQPGPPPLPCASYALQFYLQIIRLLRGTFHSGGITHRRSSPSGNTGRLARLGLLFRYLGGAYRVRKHVTYAHE